MPTPAIRSILVPTDFSTDAQTAFHHALRLALLLGAQLEILHVEPENDQSDWRWGPHLVATLIRWGYLAEGATEDDLPRLGIHVRRQLLVGLGAVEATLTELARTHADLVVVATHGRTGVEAWLHPSVATPIALKGAAPVLVVPPGSKGFVDAETGALALDRVLIPVDHRPHPAPAFDAAAALLRAAAEERKAYAEPPPTVATLHVGTTAPETDWFQPDPGWQTLHWTAGGTVVDTIAETARTWTANLVICVTEGRCRVGDSVRGSTVERLLRQTPACLLVVPHEWGTDQIGTP